MLAFIITSSLKLKTCSLTYFNFLEHRFVDSVVQVTVINA